MYAKINKLSAMRLTTAAMMVIVCSRPLLSELEFSLPLKAAATLPITNEIEGSMAPARTAASVPKVSNILSSSVRYVKNLTNGIYLGPSSTGSWAEGCPGGSSVCFSFESSII